MKKLIVVLAVLVVMAGVAWAGEKEELQWKFRALVAELNLKQADANKALQETQDFINTLDAKGYMVKDGQIVEKPKPAPEKKKEEPKK